MTSAPDDPLDPTELAAYNRWRKANNLPLEPEAFPRQQRGIHVSDKAWDMLDKIAAQQGFVWGRRGNISELMEAIGQGLLQIKEPE